MRNILLIYILIVLSSCQQSKVETNAFEMHEEEMIPITRQQEVAPPPPPLPPVESENVIKKKIIKDGRIRIEVQELEQTKLTVDSLVKIFNGYYENESLSNWDPETSYELKIRIPDGRFEKFVSALETGNGEIKYKEIQARDVTAEFIDLETRLANKKNYLVKYNELLKKAKSVKDILEIEEKIRGIEEEIESTTGRLNYLSDLVSYSTLNLTIYKRKSNLLKPEKREKLIRRIKHALSGGWFGFIDFLVFIITIWPFWIIVFLVIYGWRTYRKKRKN